MMKGIIVKTAAAILTVSILFALQPFAQKQKLNEITVSCISGGAAH